MSAPHPKVPEFLLITQVDRSVLAVPVIEIARNRAEFYKSEFGDDLQRSLDEDTLPLFAESNWEIIDWAQNNMNWEDVAGTATVFSQAPSLTSGNKQDAWNGGSKNLWIPIYVPDGD